MYRALDLIRYARTSFIALTDGLSAEQMNAVPQGFNNNLVWNLGHMIAVQQALCYKRSGVTPVVGEAHMEAYQKGTAPATPLNDLEIEKLKNLALSTLDQFDKDLKNNVFTDYEAAAVTAQKLPINNIVEAVNFVSFHEGLHLGCAQALKRALVPGNE